MKDGYWVIRTYEAGAVGEKTKYWISGTRPKGKTRRKEKSEIKKQEQNEYSCIKNLSRLINANFRKGDYVLGLDYSPAGMDKLIAWAKEHPLEKSSDDEEADRMELLRRAAEHQLQLVLRRVKYALRNTETKVRAVWVTSDMDGDTGEAVRVHHHLVIPKECLDAFKQTWKKMGGVNKEPMRGQKDFTPIAEYFLRQVRRIRNEKKFGSTRNLVRPQPKDRIVASGAEVRVPRGGQLLWRNAFKPGSPQYIRYILPGHVEDDEEPPGICG